MSFKPGLFKRIVHFINNKIDHINAKRHQNSIVNKDFSIISNNCWGGIAYEYYGIKKQTPTIGAYIFPNDYLNLVKNLKEYFNMNLVIIPVNKSKYYKTLMENGSEYSIVGRLNGNTILPPIEIIFLHYKDEKIVLEKWKRRVKRVNYDNLIFKFSYQNGCTKEQLKEFDNTILPGKKVMFVNSLSDEKEYKCAVYYPGFEQEEQILNDTFYWNKYFNVEKFVNTGEIVKKGKKR